MKIGILTSSRADFGIYSPLVEKLWNDDFFSPEIIAFGTHLSESHGYTIREIEHLGFTVKHKLITVPKGDEPFDIAMAMGHTISEFAGFWKKNQFDLVLALGDRYEMFAAVAASSPFNIKIAHIHAGETTLGAIDNAFRHSISYMSDILFTTTEHYKQRAEKLINNEKKIYNVGALSIEKLKQMDFLSIEEFKKKYKIDLSKKTILSTIHPETVNVEKNEFFINELVKVWETLAQKYQIVITLPNADTTNEIIRYKKKQFAHNRENVFIFESLGIKDYLSCMKNCSFMMGNTSSGFVEASYFPKYVINISKRQTGRLVTPNIKSVDVDTSQIFRAVKEIEAATEMTPISVYGDGDTSTKIITTIKELYG